MHTCTSSKWSNLYVHVHVLHQEYMTGVHVHIVTYPCIGTAQYVQPCIVKKVGIAPKVHCKNKFFILTKNLSYTINFFKLNDKIY